MLTSLNTARTHFRVISVDLSFYRQSWVNIDSSNFARRALRYVYGPMRGSDLENLV